MRKKYLIVALITTVMAVWLFSGNLVSNIPIADKGVDDATETQNKTLLVRAIRSQAIMRRQFLEVSGQTSANRLVHVKTEVPGRIEQIVSPKGTQVKAGDVLCRIAIDTRRSDFEKTKANLHSAQIEYDGILNLQQRSLQSKINVAKAKAFLESSRADAKRAELALQKTSIIAPFAGVVDSQPVELGDYLEVGKICVTLLEIDPILALGQVSERRIDHVKLGGEVEIELLSGKKLIGTVSFIGRAPDAMTRTYPVEVTIANPGLNIRAGLSARMKVPQGLMLAHLISSASLVLNDQGEIGVYIVDGESLVHFVHVLPISDEPAGTWVTGMPEVANIIIVGQEEVFEGQRVRVDFSPLNM